jgi:hypothetical protein
MYQMHVVHLQTLPITCKTRSCGNYEQSMLIDLRVYDITRKIECASCGHSPAISHKLLARMHDVLAPPSPPAK